MAEVQYQIEDGVLVVRVPLNTMDPPLSGTRKTLLVGTTNGFRDTGSLITAGPLAGRSISVSLNVTVPRGGDNDGPGPTRRRRRRGAYRRRQLVA
jgi:hypothetical protein